MNHIKSLPFLYKKLSDVKVFGGFGMPIYGKLSPGFLRGIDSESLAQMYDQLRDGDRTLPTLRFDKPPFDWERMQKYHTWNIVTAVITPSEQKAAFHMCSLVRMFPVEGKCLDSLGNPNQSHPVSERGTNAIKHYL
ncbi:hypothetical protein DNTS_026878 [Danionella cerebrum]|uniref:Uncharacterized protein n=1 Tax=Danionella cerebrum TaxID=2873325 RepID=A0A553QE19_9TELE|nr:hypothetical protein DNTS_026878 [Danionella translucida]